MPSAESHRATRSVSCWLASLIVGTVLLCPLWAADAREAAVHRATGRIQVDGILNEPVWRDTSDIGEFVQNVPHSGEPPTERTQVWLDRKSVV